jgi:hypothetical protein
MNDEEAGKAAESIMLDVDSAVRRHRGEAGVVVILAEYPTGHNVKV